MGSDSVLKLDYLSRAELAERPASWWQNVLGVAAFDAAAPRAPTFRRAHGERADTGSGCRSAPL
jgi:hypothetical protein